MPVESDEDLAGFFDPNEFGRPCRAHLADGSAVDFNAILTTTRVGEKPGTSFEASQTMPSLVCARVSIGALDTDDEIDLPDGRRVRVNDIAYKGDVAIIHFHEHW